MAFLLGVAKESPTAARFLTSSPTKDPLASRLILF